MEHCAMMNMMSYLELLGGFEDDFGPATALMHYGRSFRPLAEPPGWLRIGANKECFKNAARVTLNRADVFYAEGYAVDLVGVPIPIAHAWLVNSRGQVIDPTWTDASDCAYFGVVFRKAFVCRMIASRPSWSGILEDALLMRRELGTRQRFESALENSVGIFQLDQNISQRIEPRAAVDAFESPPHRSCNGNGNLASLQTPLPARSTSSGIGAAPGSS